MRKHLSAAVAASLLSLTACAAQTTTQPPAQPAPTAAPMALPPQGPPPGVRLPNEVHWFRNSAEMRAMYLQSFRLASDQLRQAAAGQRAGSWAVILDADETVLDNSLYQKRLAERQEMMRPDTWAAWVREEAATALPGAAAFTRMVHDLGGKVVIVTNRDEPLCEATRSNLRKAGITADHTICRTDMTSGNRTPRSHAVEAGTAGGGLGPLHVLMWVGDNIGDFPDQSQAIRTVGDAAFERFGRTFIMLPNPMYGSWQGNPPM
jgi:5'-nucleotidase (lipoprotein e(P4) family)